MAVLRRLVEPALAALVGVVDHPPRPALGHGHLQGVEDELGAEMRRHGPADDPATPGVQHDGQVEEAGPGGDLGDVSHPEPIRSRGRESALHQVGGGPGGGIAPGRPDGPPPAHPGPVGGAQEARDPLAAPGGALGRALRVDPRCPIGAAGAGVNRGDPLGEPRVGLGPRRRHA